MFKQHTITRLEGELQAEKVRVEKSAAAEEATKKHIETLAVQITERYVAHRTRSHCLGLMVNKGSFKEFPSISIKPYIVTHTEGVFTRTNAITVTMTMPIEIWHSVYDNNGFWTHSASLLDSHLWHMLNFRYV